MVIGELETKWTAYCSSVPIINRLTISIMAGQGRGGLCPIDLARMKKMEVWQ